MAVYQEHVRKFPGKTFYRPASTQLRFFTRTAETITKLHADPIEYMQAQFMFFPVEGKFPRPSQLTTPAAQQRWLFFQAQVEVDWLRVYLAQLSMLKAFLDVYPERSLIDIILDPQVPLHAAFRVLLCGPAAHDFLPVAQREVANSYKLQQFLGRANIDVRSVFKI